MRNWKTDEARILRVMDRICNRIDKRVQALLDSNPVCANSLIHSDWSSPIEKAVLYACKQALIPLEAKSNANRVIRHRLIIKISRQKHINRADARKLYSSVRTSELMAMVEDIAA
jgi:hypothetical protein